MYLLTDETMVALSSAVGPAGRSIVRLSGPDALDLARKCFDAADHPDSSDWPASVRLRGRVRLSEAITVPADLYVFRAPHSYTGEDLAELHLPGAPPLLQIVLETLQRAGGRSAEPGEFTARAFLNGRLDLSQAEAVAALINARSDAQLRSAERLLEGALRRHTERLADGLTDLLALVEAAIDFADQDIDLALPSQLCRQLAPLRDQLQHVLDQSIRWQELNHLPQVVIAGPANAGKSSLTNALTGSARSIVTAVAGTTRDLLTTPLALPEGPCLLIDTAGLGQVNDILAGLTQPLTCRAARQCDLLVWLVDVADERTSDQIAADLALPDALGSVSRLVVLNKIDACRDWPRRQRELGDCLPGEWLAVSAARPWGLEELKAALGRRVHGVENVAAEALALTSRQRGELTAAQACLDQAQALLADDTADQIELVALELRNGLNHLGALSGVAVTEEVLGRIFSKFCIGK